MYIICQQCDTIFRLDESLVKPTGSKVRCCQCRNVFVIYPPEFEATESDEGVMQSGASAVPQAVSEATLDRELEGIDLAELDTILDQDDGLDEAMDVTAIEEQDTAVDDAVAQWDETDLDLDFSLELEPEGEKQQPEQIQESAVDMEIDDLDLDMDFELDDGLDDDRSVGVDESDVEAMAAETPVEKAPLTDDALEMELGQLDLTLDEDDSAVEAHPPAEEAAAKEAATDELDFLGTDFDLELDEPEAVVPEAEDQERELSLDDSVEEAAADELDLLGADFESELEVDGPEAVVPEVEDQELELSLDDDEQTAPELVSEQPAGADTTPEKADDDLDLSDLDAILGLDEASEQGALDIPESSGGDDLELSLDDETETAADELPGLERDEEPGIELDGDLAFALDEEADDEDDFGGEEELELEMAPDDLGNGASSDEEDDMDLSDLDALLSDVPDSSEAADQEADENLDFELELDDGDDATSAEIADDDLEDLSFELDSEFEDESAVEQPNQEAVADLDDGEIDLSDIEQMLERDDASATAGAAIEPAEAEQDEVELGDSDEIDLSEIEAAIDAADKEDGEGIGFEEELSLDGQDDEEAPGLTLEPEPDMAFELDDLTLELESDAGTEEIEPAVAVDDSDEVFSDDSDELDLSDLGDFVENQDTTETTETIDAGEIELEFEVSDEPTEKTVVISQTAGAETADLDSTLPIEEIVPEQAGMENTIEDIAMIKKKPFGKSLLFLFIFILIGGGGYLFYAVSYMGIEIPYLSDYLNPKPKDPTGVLNLATLDINSKFIENEKSGRLFIVTGKVRNGKDTARRLIQMQGKLFTKGKVLAKTEFSYGGVSLSDQELSQQTVADIKKTISNSSGPAATVKVLPGQTAPFMIVFSDLPEGLDEFAIEVISSLQAQ